MIGFEAEASSRKLKINKLEIEDAIWVTKKKLKFLCKKKQILLPRKFAIAYSLINYWLKS